LPDTVGQLTDADAFIEFPTMDTRTKTNNNGNGSRRMLAIMLPPAVFKVDAMIQILFVVVRQSFPDRTMQA
jgi:hypothetical protein